MELKDQSEKVIIIDDEQDSIHALRLMLDRLDVNLDIVATAANVKNGIKAIGDFNPDLIFLDIRMPDGTGFDLLNQLDEINFDVIFITAYDEYALKAFNFSAIHYLLKPVDIYDLEEAIKRYDKYRGKHWEDRLKVYQNYISNQKERIVLPSREGELQVVKLSEIVWLEADGNYTIIYLSNSKKILVSKSLNTYELLLEELGFFRIHKKYMVNFSFVKKYLKGKGGEVEMDDGEILKVSARKKHDFVSGLKNFIDERG